ncbi:MAG: polysaccharide biosynthesis tyrosine autokinase [Lachnospiraceae bacterium]|nr:polysaccharide biosynthesis tyrosine autokinase [Lachnospiraceae bacterium]
MNENETMTKSPERNESSFLFNLDYFTLVKDLLKNWWVILLAGMTAVLVVNMLPYVPYVGYKPMYTASSTVIVKGTARSGDSFSTYSSSAEKFVEILTDEYVLQEVAEDMGLRKLDVEVNASIIAESNLLSLTVRSDKPTVSYGVIKGLMEHYSDISEMMYPGYVLEELVPAAYPSAPDSAYDVAQLSKKGAAAAMAAAAALILLISCMYDSVKNEKDVEKKLDAGLYAAIYHERKYKTFRMIFGSKKKKTALLINSPVVSFGFVENYRRLREKIISRCNRSGKKVILVTSMLENEGKSTVAANLALALAGVSDKVVLLDADLRKPAQYKIFERRNGIKGTLSEYLTGKAGLSKCLVKDKENGIYMIYDTVHHSNSSEIIGNGRMETLIRQLKDSMDYIIIDTPPVDMVADAETLAEYADYSILVISPDHAPVKAVNDCIDRLREGHAKLLGCVLNNIYTIPLVIRQFTGIDVSGLIGKNYGIYGSYSYGYGYGSSYGYGQDSPDSKTKRKKNPGAYRNVVSGEGFFDTRADRTADQEE